MNNKNEIEVITNMHNTKEQLQNYLKNTQTRELLNQQIMEVEEDLDDIVDAINFLEAHCLDTTNGLDIAVSVLEKKRHELDVERLQLELRLNHVEHDILVFELGLETEE